MNKRVKKLWIRALRSGKYTQAKDVLRDGDSFCCLGVLCDLHSGTRNGAEWSDEFYMGRSGTLPQAVVDWADLPSGDPEVGRTTLSALNDQGVSFADIADRIEKYL